MVGGASGLTGGALSSTRFHPVRMMAVPPRLQRAGGECRRRELAALAANKNPLMLPPQLGYACCPFSFLSGRVPPAHTRGSHSSAIAVLGPLLAALRSSDHAHYPPALHRSSSTSGEMDPAEIWRSLPVITRGYVSLCVITTAACALEVRGGRGWRDLGRRRWAPAARHSPSLRFPPLAFARHSLLPPLSAYRHSPPADHHQLQHLLQLPPHLAEA